MKTAEELGPAPKDLKYFTKFNNLKTSVLQLITKRIKQTKENPMSISYSDRIEESKEVISKLELVQVNDNLYAFPELLVNVMMEYAYRQGKEDGKEESSKNLNNLKAAMDKIYDALEDADWIPNFDGGE